MSGHRAAENPATAYIAAVEQGRQRRSFFMVRNDTHGLAYSDSRPYPAATEQLSTIQGGNKTMANQEMTHTPYPVTKEMIYQAIHDLEDYKG